MGLSIAEPDNPAVVLDDIKESCSIHTSNEDHDDELNRLSAIATELIEKACLRCFITRTLTLTLDRFPLSGCILVPRPPLSSVTSISYIDTDGDSQVWSSSKYIVGTNSHPGKITPAVNESFPTTQSRIEAVTITYDAGYGTTAKSVPKGIRQAIILAVKNWFEELTPEGDLPSGCHSLIKAYHAGVNGELYGVAS